MARKKDVQADLRESARKIWLAGLGALATAEDQGSRLFNGLVERGERYDHVLRGGVRKATAGLGDRAGKVRQKAGSAVERLESGLETGIEATLRRLDLPSRNEIARLDRKIEQLTARLDDLGSGAKPRKTKRSAKKTARKKTKTTRRRRTGQ